MPKIINEDDVFKAVLELLVTRGYERTTTSEMATAANMHEATLFRKYGSKLGLIQKAIDSQLSATPLNRLRYTGELKADLHALAQAYIETYQTYGPVIPALLVEIPHYPELKDALSRPLANIQGVVNIIQQYQEQGLLRSEPPLMTVNVLIGPILIHQLVQRALNNLPPMTINLDDHVDAFLRGRATFA